MIKQFVTEDFCLQCKGCCRFKENPSPWAPKLLREERGGLEKQVYLMADAKENNFVCACLDIPSNKCRIYPKRPFDCQLYPFLVNKRGENIFLAVDRNCPYVRQNLESGHFREYVGELADFFKSPKQVAQLKDNPQLIQAYREALDLLELEIN